MNIIPIGESILVKVLDENQETQGGAVLVGDDKDESPVLRGEVLAIPEAFKEEYENGIDGVDATPFPFEVGEVVLFRKFAGSKVPVPEENIRLIEFADVLGKEGK